MKSNEIRLMLFVQCVYLALRIPLYSALLAPQLFFKFAFVMKISQIAHLEHSSYAISFDLEIQKINEPT